MSLLAPARSRIPRISNAWPEPANQPNMGRYFKLSSLQIQPGSGNNTQCPFRTIRQSSIWKEGGKGSRAWPRLAMAGWASQSKYNPEALRGGSSRITIFQGCALFSPSFFAMRLNLRRCGSRGHRIMQPPDPRFLGFCGGQTHQVGPLLWRRSESRLAS